MKIRLDTPERLVLEERPLALALALALLVLIFATIGVTILPDMPRTGLGFLGVAGFWGLMMALLMRRTVLVLDRPSRRVIWAETTMAGRREQALFLSEIRGAEVRSRVGDRRGGQSRCCVLLRVDAPPFPLTEVWTNGLGPARAAEAINAWLGYERPTQVPAAGG